MNTELDEVWNEGFEEGYEEGYADARPDRDGGGVRRFIPQARYSSEGWMALVSVVGAQAPYWRGSRLTRIGAQSAAWRMARKLNRLEAKGRVQ